MKLCVFLFLSLCLSIKGQTQTALIARLQTSSLNELIDVVKTKILPKLIASLNAKGTIRKGKIEARGFALDTNNLDVTVETSDTGSTQSARLSVNVKNLKLNVATLNYEVWDYWWSSCTLRYAAEVKTPRMTIAFLIDIPDVAFSTDIRLSLAGVDIANIDLDLDANGSGVCGLGLSSIVSAFANAVDSVLDDELEDVIREEFSSVSADTITLTENLGLNVEDDDVVVGFVTPQVKVDRIYSTPSAITLGLTTSLSAELFSPEWRSGRGHKPLISSSIPVPPEEDFDAQVLVTFDTINALLATMWYIGWAIISDDPASQESPLCESTESDPCAFPPYLETVDFFSLEYWTLAIAFFPTYGFMKDFSIEAVVNPPALGFADNRFSGVGSGKLLLRGNGFKVDPDEALAEFEVEMLIESSAPTFDQATGTLKSLRIENFDVVTLSVDILNEGRRGLLFEYRMNKLFGWVARKLSGVVDLFLDRVNNEVEKGLERMSLNFPPVENFPVSGQTTNILLANTRVGGTALAESSFLEVASDVSVSIIDNRRREL